MLLVERAMEAPNEVLDSLPDEESFDMLVIEEQLLEVGVCELALCVGGPWRARDSRRHAGSRGRKPCCLH